MAPPPAAAAGSTSSYKITASSERVGSSDLLVSWEPLILNNKKDKDKKSSSAAATSGDGSNTVIDDTVYEIHYWLQYRDGTGRDETVRVSPEEATAGRKVLVGLPILSSGRVKVVHPATNTSSNECDFRLGRIRLFVNGSSYYTRPSNSAWMGNQLGRSVFLGDGCYFRDSSTPGAVGKFRSKVELTSLKQQSSRWSKEPGLNVLVLSGATLEPLYDRTFNTYAYDKPHVGRANFAAMEAVFSEIGELGPHSELRSKHSGNVFIFTSFFGWENEAGSGFEEFLMRLLTELGVGVDDVDSLVGRACVGRSFKGCQPLCIVACIGGVAGSGSLLVIQPTRIQPKQMSYPLASIDASFLPSAIRGTGIPRWILCSTVRPSDSLPTQTRGTFSSMLASRLGGGGASPVVGNSGNTPNSNSSGSGGNNNSKNNKATAGVFIPPSSSASSASSSSPSSRSGGGGFAATGMTIAASGDVLPISSASSSSANDDGRGCGLSVSSGGSKGQQQQQQQQLQQQQLPSPIAPSLEYNNEDSLDGVFADIQMLLDECQSCMFSAGEIEVGVMSVLLEKVSSLLLPSGWGPDPATHYDAAALTDHFEAALLLWMDGASRLARERLVEAGVVHYLIRRIEGMIEEDGTLAPPPYGVRCPRQQVEACLAALCSIAGVGFLGAAERDHGTTLNRPSTFLVPPDGLDLLPEVVRLGGSEALLRGFLHVHFMCSGTPHIVMGLETTMVALAELNLQAARLDLTWIQEKGPASSTMILSAPSSSSSSVVGIASTSSSIINNVAAGGGGNNNNNSDSNNRGGAAPSLQPLSVEGEGGGNASSQQAGATFIGSAGDSQTTGTQEDPMLSLDGFVEVPTTIVSNGSLVEPSPTARRIDQAVVERLNSGSSSLSGASDDVANKDRPIPANASVLGGDGSTEKDFAAAAAAASPVSPPALISLSGNVRPTFATAVPAVSPTAVIASAVEGESSGVAPGTSAPVIAPLSSRSTGGSSWNLNSNLSSPVIDEDKSSCGLPEPSIIAACNPNNSNNPLTADTQSLTLGTTSTGTSKDPSPAPSPTAGMASAAAAAAFGGGGGEGGVKGSSGSNNSGNAATGAPPVAAASSSGHIGVSRTRRHYSFPLLATGLPMERDGQQQAIDRLTAGNLHFTAVQITENDLLTARLDFGEIKRNSLLVIAVKLTSDASRDRVDYLLAAKACLIIWFAQNAGAAAVLFVWPTNVARALISDPNFEIVLSIPSFMLPQRDGAQLLALVQAAGEEKQLRRGVAGGSSADQPRAATPVAANSQHILDDAAVTEALASLDMEGVALLPTSSSSSTTTTSAAAAAGGGQTKKNSGEIERVQWTTRVTHLRGLIHSFRPASTTVAARCSPHLMAGVYDTSKPPGARRLACEVLAAVGIPCSPPPHLPGSTPTSPGSCKPRRTDAPIRVLCLDGGGVRGVTTVCVMKEVLRACGVQHLSEAFDMVVGCSTGAIVLTLMAVLGQTSDEAHGMYKDCAGEIFRNSWGSFAKALGKGPGALAAENFSRIIAKTIRERMPDGDTLPAILHSTHIGVPRVCFISTISSRNPFTAYLFRNYVHNAAATNDASFHECIAGEHRASFLQALRATSAAPFYLKEHKHWKELRHGIVSNDDPGDGTASKLSFIDGGFVANNPTTVAIREARQLWGRHRSMVIVSIGTGTGVPVHRKQAAGPRWLMNLVNATGNVALADATLRAMLGPKDEYYRFNPCHEIFGCDLGDASNGTLDELWDKTYEYMHTPKVRGMLDSLKVHLKQEETLPPCWCLSTPFEMTGCRASHQSSNENTNNDSNNEQHQQQQQQ